MRTTRDMTRQVVHQNPSNSLDASFVLSGRSLRQLWSLMNTPRPVDYRGVRLVSGVFFVGYLIASIVRTTPDSPAEFVVLRAVVCAYALYGVALGRRGTTWSTLRVYVLVLALVLPILTGYMAAIESPPSTALSLTAFVCIAALLFLLTPIDLAITAIVHATIFSIWAALAPPSEIALATTIVVIGGALSVGVTLSLVLNMFRAGMNERIAWWQVACERERALREFAELATSQGTGVDELFARYLEIFRGDADDARGLLVLRSGEELRIASFIGVPGAENVGELNQLSSVVLRAIAATVRSQQPLVAEGFRGDLEEPSVGLTFVHDLYPETVVTVPIIADGEVTGVAVLTASEAKQVGREDLLLWQSIATQLGIAISRADLVLQLQSALSAKNEFVNTMSHELRSPLNVIIGYAEMLAEAGVEVSGVADRIRGSGMELLQLVENTMAVAQMGSGKLGLRLEDFSLSDLAAELDEHVRALPEAKGKAHIQWRIPTDLPIVHLDRLKVKEVLQNLISNALKYSGGAEVTVSMASRGAQVELAVTDRGKGIPLEAQSRIFEMFERGEGDRQTATPGVGLGLYIVKTLVDLMHGRIELASSGREGTRFTVALPVEIEDGAGSTDNPRASADCAA